MYLGQDEFLGSSANFNPEGERLGYVRSSQGDRRVQGVIDYKNQDLYSFGGRTRIQSAMPNAEADLNNSASGGCSYFEVVKGIQQPDGYEKEYHEEVNDYQKNISDGIFSPGLSLEQYRENRREENPAYNTINSLKRSSSAGRVRRKPRNKNERTAEIERRVAA